MYVHLSDPAGQPIANRVLSFHDLGTQPRVSTLGGVIMLGDKPVTAVTNSSGYAEVRLLRGILVEMAITGTGYVRRVTIPDRSAVNLLDLIGESQDQFDVARITPLLAPRFS